ncbi:hypothetical protein NQZ79_g1236 [Umbelopsis isabellina]|nr:hypothetical protein NQZ79_g1236 [Umbelopsis isabellina]
MSTIQSVPSTLPVIPLDSKVLLPSVVTKVIVSGDAAAYVSKTLKVARKDRSRQAAYVAVVPVCKSAGDKTLKASLDGAYFNNDGEEEKTIKTDKFTIKSKLVSDKTRSNSGLNLFHFGCAARVIQVDKSDNAKETVTLFLQGVCRFRINELNTSDGVLSANVTHYPETNEMHATNDNKEFGDVLLEFRSLSREFISKMKDLKLPGALLAQLAKVVDKSPPSQLANLLASVIETTFDEKLEMLETTDTKPRLQRVNEWMTRQLHVLKITQQIQSNVDGKLDKKRREFYLRQQLNAIKEELGEKGDDASASGGDDDELTELKRKLDAAQLSKEAQTVADREMKRLKKLHPSSAEWSVVRTYLDVMADLPWSKTSEDVIDIHRAREQLEADHYGLDTAKKRILEYLSVVKVKGDLKAPIICFVGPPGVGKTSLGKSIASATGRDFHRISLGGVRDEADIRGHRRTYVGAMPGLIIHGMRKSGVNNPVFLLDEIDKIVKTSHYGDPAAAMLEVLDPEQNSTFTDHYLNIPFDLSKVLFIATANSIDTIPAPLLDRMEVISLPGYTFDEKLHIAKTYLLPKQIKEHGLTENQVCISDEVLLKIIENYTRESGVRNLERTIASIVRFKCVEWADLHEADSADTYNEIVQVDDLENILGMQYFEKEIIQNEAIPGVVTGLAYSGSGNGGILMIEATHMPGEGKLQLTGSLGDVIKESAQIALAWVKSHAHALKLTNASTENIADKRDVHIHFPAGAVSKDGPSAGIALTTALVSLFSGRCVPNTTAMTGEITLRGRVLPVGGIKEKVLSAHRAGIKKVILPARNRKDVSSDIPDSIKKSIEFVYVKNISEVLEAALVLDEHGEKLRTPMLITRIESHL